MLEKPIYYIAAKRRNVPLRKTVAMNAIPNWFTRQHVQLKSDENSKWPKLVWNCNMWSPLFSNNPSNDRVCQKKEPASNRKLQSPQVVSKFRDSRRTVTGMRAGSKTGKHQTGRSVGGFSLLATSHRLLQQGSKKTCRPPWPSFINHHMRRWLRRSFPPWVST